MNKAEKRFLAVWIFFLCIYAAEYSWLTLEEQRMANPLLSATEQIETPLLFVWEEPPTKMAYQIFLLVTKVALKIGATLGLITWLLWNNFNQGISICLTSILLPGIVLTPVALFALPLVMVGGFLYVKTYKRPPPTSRFRA